MGFAIALAVAALWMIGFASFGAGKVKPGESVLAVFPPSMSSAQVANRIADSFDKAMVRQFSPAGFGNLWIAQAGEGPGLARALKDHGAILVLMANGPIHFAFGCGIDGPPGRGGPAGEVAARL
jgi:hypothetical protein